jgi:hypothetical protein
MVAISNSSYVEKKFKLLICGFTGGLLQAGLFNPWDRALYLSIKMDRPFLSRINFRNPFAGLYQTIFQRAMSAGLYFPLEEIFADLIVQGGMYGNDAGTLNAKRHYIGFTAGLFAGSLSGLIMNPLAAVKYHYWGTETGKESFVTTSAQMLKKGGMRIFLVGTTATVLRDLVFGGTYGLLRHTLASVNVEARDEDGQSVLHRPTFVQNLIAASMGTVLSSPWNYVRNIHYGTPSGVRPDTTLSIWQGLLDRAAEEKSLFRRLKLLQVQLRVGWGTARVGCGMAVSSSVYAYASEALG